jgi:hypothetical protein
VPRIQDGGRKLFFNKCLWVTGKQCKSTSCTAILISTRKNLWSFLLLLILSLQKIRDKGKIVSAW